MCFRLLKRSDWWVWIPETTTAHTPTSTSTLLQLLCFFLFRADFSCLFHCTKHFFMPEEMFMLTSVQLAVNDLLGVVMRGAKWSAAPKRTLSVHPLKDSSWLSFWFVFVLEEIYKISMIWAAICLPGAESDNIHTYRGTTEALSWCEAALKAVSLKACWPEAAGWKTAWRSPSAGGAEFSFRRLQMIQKDQLYVAWVQIVLSRSEICLRYHSSCI